MAKTIEQLQADLQAFRASKGQGSAAVAPTPAPAPQPEAPTLSPIQQDLEAYRADKGVYTPKSKIPKEGGSGLADFAKAIFSAPATIVARPFQAVAAIAGADNADIDKFTEKIPVLGGLIAPTPKSGGDVIKDVGRAAQTVALGLSPISGGALFGAGQAVQDQDAKDLLSAQTAFDIALGAGGGKILGLVGKPLLNTAGKVVGTITPKILKDVAASGAEGIQRFAATHDLLGGVAAKPSAALARGSAAIDSKIESAASKATGVLSKTAKEQFPGLSPTDHYQAVNAKDIVRPTTVNEPKYAKGTRIFNEAQDKGIDLADVANKRGIIHDQIAEGGRYNTTDVVDNLRQNNFEVSDRIARPAIKAAEPGVPRVPLKDVRSAMLKKINSIPDSQIDPADRAKMLTMINKKYAGGGAVDSQFPDGYNLTNLHDSRIIAGKNGGYKPGASSSDALKAQLSREEGRVFADLFDKSAPEELGIKPFKKELEKNFLLADYLEALHGKQVPAGITKRAVRLFGRALTATVGGKIGGFPGSILGAQYGDMLFSTFETLPNPIKMKVLQSVKVEDPAIFKELVQYIGRQESERLMRPLLGPAGSSSFKETPPTMFVTPKGRASTSGAEAADVAAVETGRAKAPSTDRRLKSYLEKVKYAQDAEGMYVPEKDLPTIKMGKKPKAKKSLNDIY